MLQPLPLHPRRGIYRYACGAAGEHASTEPNRVGFEPRCDTCVERMGHLLEAHPDEDHWWLGPKFLHVRRFFEVQVRLARLPRVQAAS